jgi:hypothetical protein
MPVCPFCKGVSEGDVCQYCRVPFAKSNQPINVTVNNYTTSPEKPVYAPPPPHPQSSPQPTKSSSAQPNKPNQAARMTKPRTGFQGLGIAAFVFAVSYAILGLAGEPIMGDISMPVMFGMAIFMLIIGIMFLILSRSPKGQEHLFGNKGLKKSAFVAICFTLAFTAVMVASVTAVPYRNNTSSGSDSHESVPSTTPSEVTDNEEVPAADVEEPVAVQQLLDIAETVPLLDDGRVDKKSDIYEQWIGRTVMVSGKVSIADTDANEIELTATGSDDFTSVSCFGLPSDTIAALRGAEYPFGNQQDVVVRGTITEFDDLGITLADCTLIE